MKVQKPTLLNTIFILLLCVAFSQVHAQTITTPRASPATEITQTVGISNVTINYSRPLVKDREVWGKLVPYGMNNLGFGTATAAPWRAGANENTTITFSDNAKIEGKDIAAGTYGLHIEVKEGDDATIIFSNNSTSWGSFFYDPTEDALKVDVKTAEISHMEQLTYNFENVGKNSAKVCLDWEKKRFPFNVSYNTDEIVMGNARNELRNIKGFGWQGPNSAAQYALRNNVNQEEALAWVDQSIKANKTFNNVMVKASLLKQKGNAVASMKLFDEAAKMGNIGQLNFLGYQMLNQHKNNAKAIEYFKLNAKKNPKIANVHDSLGEAYKINGDKKLAIKSLKKSLSLNPPANVKAYTIKQLKELGVDAGS